MPELTGEYPLVLTTGARVWSMFHSEHRQIPRMRALHPEPLVYVNPATAAQHGVKDGDWVWLENQHGRCKRQVRETPIVNERTVNFYADYNGAIIHALAQIENCSDGACNLNDSLIQELVIRPA